MNHAETDRLVQQLAGGFEALQDEYQTLFGQYQSLERKLATAREQYNELAKLCGSGETSTPPLSLASLPKTRQQDAGQHVTTADIIEQRPDVGSTAAAGRVRDAVTALRALHDRAPRRSSTATEGVMIWGGPSADKTERASSMMPSISESPLEQDFTIEGKPSRLGCPFANMANKRLSSHAASVMSKYNSRDSAGGVPSTPLSSVSVINGKESFLRRNSSSRRASIADPIKAEICGLSAHGDDEDRESPHSERAVKQQPQQPEKAEGAETGVCPIRFMDQHSPEEVATYFEKHKHELPRSHEVCVRRYQSNEDQIRQLDAKYGNLVSMIQGLGARHKDMLPEEPAETAVDPETALDEAKSTEMVRKWASSVSAGGAGMTAASEDVDGDRQPHFERPLRDIRVGESPSRPWGIQVPARYLEESRSETSSKPAQVVSSPPPLTKERHQQDEGHDEKIKPAEPAARCPFGFDKAPIQGMTEAIETKPVNDEKPLPAESTAAFVAMPEPSTSNNADEGRKPPQMVFTGPVFIGYNAADAAKILRDSGLGSR